ncbi:MAG: uroporphyrinogen-III C-methyltransferase [Chloroflexi bacterium AL-W]|nr:uroporphyrinogen-III C-methyltransferase [Chloroflexi bacterium AL-N1]NOK67104.1 uroporphyrinogen-III C-methyltransferase [Chloroflexi bacterium AL-N10]NOK74603.1 uroporphyrinogen-III C-methyltransferase [Chloroflexi bacterium AL-N5]NOK81706.1 uroporphyrinogen-III C-methyltransferase [Chloroflexi bacterium AL-W]NOK89176.1 uroporphyrinogen-III C-methyltransferase [Chloroflexi bacterium AL-N15]
MISGLVSLIGAGPGDPDLITVKGLRRLQTADVVIYDALINQDLLHTCRADAELIYVGKRAGQPRQSQASINALLVDRALQGYQVVRLKGGDPFVFGRGGEEAEALTKAGITWEVVPGVSSAIGVPAYAGIPVTHRTAASSVAIITGHEDPHKPHPHMNWHALAQGIDTLVFLMGVSHLSHIAGQLIAHGRAKQTPAAVIHWGTTLEQEVVTGTLVNIADEVVQAGLTTPATLVIGEVVRLREQLRWFDVLQLAEHID